MQSIWLPGILFLFIIQSIYETSSKVVMYCVKIHQCTRRNIHTLLITWKKKWSSIWLNIIHNARKQRYAIHWLLKTIIIWKHFINNWIEMCKQKFSYQLIYHKTQSFSQVYYEQLVLHPEEWMRKILKFVDVPWNESVLHHEEFINKPNGVSLSKYVYICPNSF